MIKYLKAVVKNEQLDVRTRAEALKILALIELERIRESN